MGMDAERIYSRLEEAGGYLPFHDKTSPEIIKREFQISKAAFKRAIGRLMKQKRYRSKRMVSTVLICLDDRGFLPRRKETLFYFYFLNLIFSSVLLSLLGVVATGLSWIPAAFSILLPSGCGRHRSNGRS